MKHFFLLLTALMLCFCGCNEPEKPKLVMVTNATFPPYEYVSGGAIDGIDPEIVRQIANRLGYELEIQDMAFDSVIAAVQSGKAHIAASGITVTEDRKKQVAFTDPYVIAAQVIIVPKNSPIKGIADLKGKRIGVQHGTTGDSFVTDKIQEPERYKEGPVAVAALVSGKLDVVVIDGEPAQAYIAQNPSLMILPEPLTTEEYAFAIAKHNQNLLREFNEELKKMKESGELESIILHYKKLNSENISEEDFVTETVFGKIKASFYVNFIKDNRYKYLLEGFWITLQITFFSVLMGIIIGFGVAVVRSTADQTGKLQLLDWICRIYLTVIRGTPVVVQLLIIYFVIFGSVNVDKILVAVIAFGINSGAYVAEIIRGGIMSIDKGQMEAGRSLGLSYWQSMREIILPQAFKNVLPALGNEFIVLLKETSVAGYIALQDLTKGGDIIRSQTYDAFFPLIAVALIYLVVVMFLSWLLGRLEKRLKRNE
ncbi:MAG: ABC transporter permease subunit [Lentisphaeria bacterium]|nr:ABC transporter permease subunit [Lentisphaeria bacterium]